MARNRRDFLKVSAAIGVLGVSDASAKPVRRRHRRTSNPYIAVISSIAIDPSLLGTFTQQLPGGTTVTPYPSLTYKKNKLARQIKKLDNDSACLLIVTVGGSVAYEVANAYLTDANQKHFISLVGSLPEAANQSSQLYGGVALKSAETNSFRITWLTNNAKFQPNQITLLRNLNSEMRARESALWQGNECVVNGGNDTNGDNSSATYAADFAKVSTPAVIISADPHFQDSKAQLIQAANTWGGYVCYPLQDYNSGAPTPTKGVIIGPSLLDAYKTLGQHANMFLQAGASPGIVPVQNPNQVTPVS
jgi:hypothetical protein